MYTFTMYDMHIGYYWNRKTFTSVSAFLQVMSQLTFWLIPITERTTVGYSIFFIVLDRVSLSFSTNDDYTRSQETLL